jgi:SAM-dependent methyltransferase
MSEPIPKQYYEEYWAAGFSGWLPGGVTINRFEEKLLASLIPRYSKVLDFGCGDGSRAGSFLRSNECSYLGADVSETAVAKCRGKGLEAIRFSPEARLPLDDDAFDTVLSFEVFEHLFDPQAALRDIRRVLSTGGCLVGSVPNSVYVANRLLMALGHFSPGGSPATSLRAPWKDPHIRFFNKRTLLSCLSEAGFRKCVVIGRDFSLRDFPVLYRSASAAGQLLVASGRPFAFLGKWWPSVFSARLYFAAHK